MRGLEEGTGGPNKESMCAFLDEIMCLVFVVFLVSRSLTPVGKELRFVFIIGETKSTSVTGEIGYEGVVQLKR
jgi:hypothetical protein